MKVDNEKIGIFLALVIILWAALTVAIWCSSEWQTLIKLAVTTLTSLAACGLSISLVLKISVEKNEQTQSANGGQNIIINKPAIEDRQEVIFPVPYKERPFVVLSLDRIDEGQFIEESQFKSQDNKPLLHTVNRLEIAAVSVSATGFVLEIKTWYNNLIYGYKVSWTAFGVE